MRIDQQWQERSALYSRLSVSGKDGFMLILREIETECDGAERQYDFEKSRREREIRNLYVHAVPFRAGSPACTHTARLCRADSFTGTH